MLKKLLRNMLSRDGMKKRFGGHVNWERIVTAYVEWKRDDSLTIRSGEEVMENCPLQGQATGQEVIKEVFGTMRSEKKF